MVVTFIIIIINRCVKSSVLGAPLGSPGGETHTGEGLTVWGSPDGLWPSSLCLEVWRQGNGSLSLFFFYTRVWWYFCFTTVHHYKTMKTSGVYFQYKEDPYLTWISATSHLYNKTGEYTISVEAVNSVGSVTREKTIHVYGNGPHIFFF